MCMQMIGVPKEYNISWHYKTYHHGKQETCTGEPNHYRIKRKSPQNQHHKQIRLLTEPATAQTQNLAASYEMCLRWTPEMGWWAKNGMQLKWSLQLWVKKKKTNKSRKFVIISLTIESRIIDTNNHTLKIWDQSQKKVSACHWLWMRPLTSVKSGNP